MVQRQHLVLSGLDMTELQLQGTASPRGIPLDHLMARSAGARLHVGGRLPWHGPVTSIYRLQAFRCRVAHPCCMICHGMGVFKLI